MACLLDGAAEPGGLIHGHGIEAADRLRIYRGNIIENYTASLRSSFPVLVRLVGEDYFRDAARQLHATRPSLSGDLANVGEALAAFLLERHGADQYRYLADVARFEWLCRRSSLAAGHAPFDLAKLASVGHDDHHTLRFALHPSVNLFESPYPCLQIWQSHAEQRIDDELTFHSLNESEHIFLRALESDYPLGTAIEVAMAADAAFDAAKMLERSVTTHLIVDVVNADSSWSRQTAPDG
jgi:hypothetical protein